jgi:hypothetical protein
MADGAIVSRDLLEENAPAPIESGGFSLCYDKDQRKQERGDRALVRSVFGWGAPSSSAC